MFAGPQLMFKWEELTAACSNFQTPKRALPFPKQTNSFNRKSDFSLGVWKGSLLSHWKELLLHFSPHWLPRWLPQAYAAAVCPFQACQIKADWSLIIYPKRQPCSNNACHSLEP